MNPHKYIPRLGCLRFIACAVSLFGILQPTLRGDSANASFWGINANPYVGDSTKTQAQNIAFAEAECDQIIASGVKMVRLSPYWSQLERDGDNIWEASLMSRLDVTINRLHAGGVQTLVVLGHTPSWASSGPEGSRKYHPTNWDDWDGYVSYMTAKYKGKVKYWEIWNEPDNVNFWLDGVANYVTLLQRAYPIIKAADPSNVVLLAGMASTNGASPPVDTMVPGGFFDQVLASASVGNYFDVLNYHYYGTLKDQVAGYNSMNSIRQARGFGGRPVWLTETGFSTSGTADLEFLKADMVDQAWTFYVPILVDKAFYYNYRNIPSSGDPLFSNYGLVQSDLTPLKAFYHFQSLGGAEANAFPQKVYPTEAPAMRSLYHIQPTGGDGVGSDGYLVIPVNNYAYFSVDDSFAYNTNETYYVDVEYKNNAPAGNAFLLHYQSTTNDYASLSRARTNSGTWETYRFVLANGKFVNGQNGKCDFRIYSGGVVELQVKSITLTRVSTGESRRLMPADTGSANLYYGVHIPAGKCMYLRVNDQWVLGNNDDMDPNLYLELIYKDVGSSISVEHQAAGGVTYQTQSIPLTNTGAWIPITLTLNNINLLNGQNNAADLRIRAGGTGIDIRSPILYRALNPASCRVKTLPVGKMMRNRVFTDPNHEAYTTVVTEGGWEGRRAQRVILSNGTNSPRYHYFDVSEALIHPGVTNVTIAVTYWDRTDGAATTNLHLQYNSTTGGAYKYYTPTIIKGNTLQWKTAVFTLTDANFNTGQGNLGDFRLFSSDAYGLTIRHVTVTAN